MHRLSLAVNRGFIASSFDPACEQRFDATQRQSRDASKGETTMKRITAFAFLAATLVLMSSACAHAQSVEFKVPFDFNVIHKVLPAGIYRVSYASENMILIQSQDGRLQAFSSTYAGGDRSTGSGKLVFRQYGDQYFLHQVLCSNADINAELPTSRLEQRVRIQKARLPQSQTVAALDIRAK
jgi:hypothetical protein